VRRKITREKDRTKTKRTGRKAREEFQRDKSGIEMSALRAQDAGS
jgi:hypothetical protein